MITESVTINSKKAAKLNVLIICGVHGDESYAVKLVNNFKKNLDPKKFSEKIGKVTFVLANQEGLKANSRVYSVSTENNNFDLNRAFGYEKKAEAYDSIVEKIKEEVEKNQIVIDVHNSPNCEPSILIDYDGPNSDEIVWFLKESLVNTFMPTIRKSGVNSIKNFVNNCSGKIGFTVEIPGMGYQEVEGAFNYFNQALINLINVCAVNFFVPNKEMPAGDIIGQENITKPLYSKYEGIINWVEKPFYNAGEKICSVEPFDSNKYEHDIYAPEDCFLVCKSQSLYADAGSVIAEFQPISSNLFKAWENLKK